MFDEITLIMVTETKNKNKENIKVETPMTVAATVQNVSRSRRDIYQANNLGHSKRFRLSFIGDSFDEDAIAYFEHRGRRYTVKEFIRDKTKTGYYIEGVSSLKGGVR